MRFPSSEFSAGLRCQQPDRPTSGDNSTGGGHATGASELGGGHATGASARGCRDVLSRHACRPDACALDFCPTCPAPGLCDLSCAFCGASTTPAPMQAPPLAEPAEAGLPPAKSSCSLTELSREDILAKMRGSNLTVQWWHSWEAFKQTASGICKAAISTRFQHELMLAHRDGVLCAVGDGIQTRGSSTAEMLRRAMAVLRRRGEALPSFCGMRLALTDNSGPEHLLGYHGATRFPIPDFTFLHWREAGLCPDFDTVVARLRTLSKRPPKLRKCGWVGAVNSHARILILNASLEWPDMVEAIWPRQSQGTATGRMTMEEQVSRYACLIDARGLTGGYSGRVPMLLHSGRPLIYAERSKEFFFDRTFYTYGLPEKLQAWKHFIPTDKDMTNIEELLRWVLSPANAAAVQQIVENAQQFAAKYLTLEAAVDCLADKLLAGARILAERQAKGERENCPS